MPSVHVWNCRTLESLSVMQGIHKKGVHLLSFTKDDRYLVTCGLMQPSPILIYDWEKGEIIISTSINSPTQDIFTMPEMINLQQTLLPYDALNEYEKKRRDENAYEGVVVISLHEIVFFTIRQKSFTQSFLSFE